MTDIPQIVRTAKRIAVVGWSDDPMKPSNDVTEYLYKAGYDMIAVNPRLAGAKAYGNPIVPDIQSAGNIDVVLIFRRPPDVPQHEADAIAARVPVFWMQLGIRNEDVAARLREQGITVVQDRCFKIEHGRLAA